MSASVLDTPSASLADDAFQETLRLTVVWHPSLESGPRLAGAIAEAFDRIGMIRDNTRLSVPVRVRTSSARGSPRPIDFGRAETSGIVILADGGLARAARRGWRSFLQSVFEARRRSGGSVFVIVIAADEAGKRVVGDDDGHVEGSFVGQLADPSGQTVRRLGIRLLAAVGQHFKAAHRGGDQLDDALAPDVLFISHASNDGRDIAEWIDGYVRSVDLGVTTFIDSRSIPAGMNFRRVLEHSIARSAFLAVQTDAWCSRPYCQWELMHAKRNRRPIVLLKRIQHGEDRAFPYAGNIATRTVRLGPVTRGDKPRWLHRWWRSPRASAPLEDAETEQIIAAVCAEVLRCLVWERTAARVLSRLQRRDAIILPRPPELADLALVRGSGHPARLMVYPDPPLGHVERDLLDALRGEIEIKALSEVSGAYLA